MLFTVHKPELSRLNSTTGLPRPVFQMLTNNSWVVRLVDSIPGSVGGGVRMNAGCFGKEFKDVLISIQAIDTFGNVVTIPAKKVKFDYRKKIGARFFTLKSIENCI